MIHIRSDHREANRFSSIFVDMRDLVKEQVEQLLSNHLILFYV